MYHSIPGVHKAELLHKDVDYSDIAALADTDAQQHSRAHQEEETTIETDADEAKVSRRTRITFECHPSVLLADLLDDFLLLDDSGHDVLGMGSDDDFDAIVSMFTTSSKQYT